jgi:hypothetical protein
MAPPKIGIARPLSSAAKPPQSPDTGAADRPLGVPPLMKIHRLPLLALALAAAPAAAPAETLGNPQIGFTAERLLVFDGHSYVGRMWNMPGEQRHEQSLAAVKPIFILHADSTIGDLVLANLHMAVEFGLPRVLAALSRPALLGRPVGHETVNGIATIKYAVDKTVAQGRLAGALWLGDYGIPMRCDGSFTGHDGRVSTVHWELRKVEIGRQDAALFEVPPGYSKLPPEAAAVLLGLRLAPHGKQ